MMAANDNFMHCPPSSNPPHSVESNLAICSPQFDHGYHSLPNSRKSSYNLALTNPPTPHGSLDGTAKPSHQMESMSIVDPIRYITEDDDEKQQKEGGAGTLGHHWGMPSNVGEEEKLQGIHQNFCRCFPQNQLDIINLAKWPLTLDQQQDNQDNNTNG
jgi:hypothetical protein